MGDSREPIDITWKVKMADLKWKAVDVKNKIFTAAKNNKEIVAVAIPILAKMGYDIVKDVRRRSVVNEEKRLKDNYVWDPKLGMYFECKRKLTTNQRLEFEARRGQGESVGHILRSMKVLK